MAQLPQLDKHHIIGHLAHLLIMITHALELHKKLKTLFIHDGV